jgi:hypothetical protein
MRENEDDSKSKTLQCIARAVRSPAKQAQRITAEAVSCESLFVAYGAQQFSAERDQTKAVTTAEEAIVHAERSAVKLIQRTLSTAWQHRRD